jgi:hypothetical protein
MHEKARQNKHQPLAATTQGCKQIMAGGNVAYERLFSDIQG